jgi:hypothetical protein
MDKRHRATHSTAHKDRGSAYSDAAQMPATPPMAGMPSTRLAAMSQAAATPGQGAGTAKPAVLVNRQWLLPPSDAEAEARLQAALQALTPRRTPEPPPLVSPASLPVPSTASAWTAAAQGQAFSARDLLLGRTHRRPQTSAWGVPLPPPAAAPDPVPRDARAASVTEVPAAATVTVHGEDASARSECSSDDVAQSDQHAGAAQSCAAASDTAPTASSAPRAGPRPPPPSTMPATGRSRPRPAARERPCDTVAAVLACLSGEDKPGAGPSSSSVAPAQGAGAVAAPGGASGGPRSASWLGQTEAVGPAEAGVASYLDAVLPPGAAAEADAREPLASAVVDRLMTANPLYESPRTMPSEA